MDEKQVDPPQGAAEPEGSVSFDFDSMYANNTYFESSVWDLKIIFGQLEQHSGETRIDWHTAMTIPWLQAKILSYFLSVNVALHEARNGALSIPAQIVPPKPKPPSAEDPAARVVYEFAKKLHEEIFG